MDGTVEPPDAVEVGGEHGLHGHRRAVDVGRRVAPAPCLLAAAPVVGEHPEPPGRALLTTQEPHRRQRHVTAAGQPDDGQRLAERVAGVGTGAHVGQAAGLVAVRALQQRRPPRRACCDRRSRGGSARPPLRPRAPSRSGRRAVPAGRRTGAGRCSRRGVAASARVTVRAASRPMPAACRANSASVVSPQSVPPTGPGRLPWRSSATSQATPRVAAAPAPGWPVPPRGSTANDARPFRARERAARPQLDPSVPAARHPHLDRRAPAQPGGRALSRPGAAASPQRVRLARLEAAEPHHLVRPGPGPVGARLDRQPGGSGDAYRRRRSAARRGLHAHPGPLRRRRPRHVDPQRGPPVGAAAHTPGHDPVADPHRRRRRGVQPRHRERQRPTAQHPLASCGDADVGHPARAVGVAPGRLRVTAAEVERPALEAAADDRRARGRPVAVGPRPAVAGLVVGPVGRGRRVGAAAVLAVRTRPWLEVLACRRAALQPADERQGAVDSLDRDASRVQRVQAGEVAADPTGHAPHDRAAVEPAEVDHDGHAAIGGADPPVPRAPRRRCGDGSGGCDQCRDEQQAEQADRRAAMPSREGSRAAPPHALSVPEERRVCPRLDRGRWPGGPGLTTAILDSARSQSIRAGIPTRGPRGPPTAAGQCRTPTGFPCTLRPARCPRGMAETLTRGGPDRARASRHPTETCLVLTRRQPRVTMRARRQPGT